LDLPHRPTRWSNNHHDYHHHETRNAEGSTGASRAALAAPRDNRPRYVAYRELRPRYGETRSRTQLRRDIAAGLYPPPRQLSKGRIGWVTDELDDHYDDLPVVSYADAVA